MPVLPTPGASDDVWAVLLNNFILAFANADGSLNTAAVEAAIAGVYDGSGAAAAAQTAAEAFATSAVGTETTRATTAEALLAPKANPSFTGTATAPRFSADFLTAAGYIGRHDGSHPPNGVYLAGDWSVDGTTPGIWITLAGGTNPTDWVNIASSVVAGVATAVEAASQVASKKLFTIAGITTTGDLDSAVQGGFNSTVVQASWSALQPSSGALNSGAVTSLITAIQNAITAGLTPILDPGYQYAPSFVTSGVEQFKDQAGNTYPASGLGSDHAVTNWMWSATGRTDMTDYTTKLVAALTGNNVTDQFGNTVTALSMIGGIRIGGGFSGELHYPKVTDMGVTINTSTAYTPGSTTSLTFSGLTGGVLGTSGIIQSTDGTGTLVAFTANDGTHLTVSSTPLMGTTVVNSGTATWKLISIWAYGTNPQRSTSGGDLATDQTPNPYPGYVPFVGPSQSSVKDAAWFAWWTGGLTVFQNYLLNTWKGLLGTWPGNLWVLHADVGIRVPTPSTFPNATLNGYLGQAVQGCDHEAGIAAYGAANGYPYGSNVYPDCTWVDQGITGGIVALPWTPDGNPAGTSTQKMPAWAWILEIARKNGVSARIVGENSNSTIDWADVFAPGGPVESGYYGILAVQSGPTSNPTNFAAVTNQILTPHGPTAPAGTASTQLASTAFVAASTTHPLVFSLQVGTAGNAEIVRSLPDGTGQVTLTNNPAYDSWWPKLSPDGQRIIFLRAPYIGGTAFDNSYQNRQTLWIMNSDGSGLRELLAVDWADPGHTDSWLGTPNWHPNSRDILFFGGQNPTLTACTLNVDSSAAPVQLSITNAVTNTTLTVMTDTSWSPSGLEFVMCADDNVFVVNAETLIATPLTTDGNTNVNSDSSLRINTDPNYDPNGETIYFLTQFAAVDGGHPLGQWGIRSVSNTDFGMAVTPVTLINDGNANSKPVAGPDGNIYFHRFVYGTDTHFSLGRLPTSAVSAAQTDVTRLTDGTVKAYQPDILCPRLQEMVALQGLAGADTGVASWAPLSTLATWSSSRDYLSGPPAAIVNGSDSLIYGAVENSGPSYGGAVNPVGDSTGHWVALTFASGAAGATGSTGAAGSNGQSFNYRGAWAALTTYAPFDIVYETGFGLLMATTSFTSGSSFSLTNWTVLVPPGATIWSSTGAPSNGTGNNGDFDIDPVNGELYGPKASGSWPAGISLIGPQGNTNHYGSGAPSNGLGINGDTYIDDNAWFIYAPKAAGVWPAGVSLIGPAGATNDRYSLTDRSYKAWTFAPEAISAGVGISNTLQAGNLISMKVQTSFTLTKLKVMVTNAAAKGAGTVAYCAAYQNGNLLDVTADISSTLAAGTGMASLTFTGGATVAANQIVTFVIWTNTTVWTTAPSLGRAGGGNASVNDGLASPYLSASVGTGVLTSSTPPSTFAALGTVSQSSAGWWGAAA